MGPVLGPQWPHQPCPGHMGNRPWPPAPRDGQPREVRCLTTDASHHGGRSPPPSRIRGLAARPTSGRPVEGGRLPPPRASERPAEPAEPTFKLPHPHAHGHGTCNKTGRYRHGTSTGGPHPIPCSQAQQLNNGGTNGPTQNAPPISNAGRGARRYHGAGTLRRRRPPPPPEDADADSDLEMFPEAPTGSAPAVPALPAGSVPALCPA